MRYVLYCKGRRPTDDYARIFTPIFEDITMAKAFVSVFMGNEPLIPIDNTLSWNDSFTIRCSHMDEIIKVEDGVLPDHYHKQVLQFKYSHWEKPEPKADGATDGTKPAPSLMRERRPGRPTGYVTITELATTWGIPALHARAALRASDRVKPDYGWSFAPDEVPAIKKLCGVKT